MHNQIPMLNVDLHISPEFSGRILLHVKQGRVTSDRRLLETEHVSSLDGFIELVRLAGWRIEPHRGE
ncbi:hypothetical protein [Cedecea sp.]|jgi:hypothetical protein|uniref:hypothetical protein n=1 Tax=Cedecea sp. TaxID=1970739 RepID=UPI002F404E2A